MSFTENHTILFSLLFSFYFSFTHATTFHIINQCNYTVWAAAVPSGGRQLEPGRSWNISINGTTVGRIWGRTNCSFNANGQGQCETGDCNRTLECRGNGKPPNTLAEFALYQPSNMDYYDISLVDGFNIPTALRPTSNMCRGREARCAAAINEECPNELRAPGGCNNPCTVFQTNEYCCYNGPGTCGPTVYSRFFRERCPDAYYGYPQDEQPSMFSCPVGTDYSVVFCP